MAERTRTTAQARLPLDRDRVFLAAVELADDGGLEGLTMRRLAETLGVEAMSLYHHVSNKETILDGMIDLVFSEIEVPDVDWRKAMRRRARSARAALARHAWAIGLMESRRNPGIRTLRHHDAVLGCLRRAGFTIAQAAHAFSVLDSYIYGFAMQEQNLPFRNSAELEQMAAELLPQLSAEQFPYMTEMIVKHALKPGYSYAHEFDVGLDLILDGLERMRTPRKR
jgi:AcrR family transcriptional regulator